MASRGLGDVGAEQPVPPGQVEAVVRVGLPRIDGVVDAVHVGGDHEQPKHAVDGARQVDIGVVEERGGVEQHLEQEHRDGGRAEGCDHRQLDPHRDQDLDRVKTQAGGGVEVEIGMVHPVQPPEPGNGVEHDVLQVDREVEQQHRDQDRDPGGHVDDVEQAPALVLGRDGKADREDREGQPQDHCIKHHERQVVGPADDARDLPPPPGCGDFPDRHGRQHAQKRGKAYHRFGGEDNVGHGSLSVRGCRMR